MDVIDTLAEHAGARGGVVLRRRSGPDRVVDELIVNGTFAMDSAETETERELGALALTGGGPRVLVGGLGLGYTVSAILDLADSRGTEVRIDVAEIEECLIDWARSGLTSALARAASDPRVQLQAADVADVLAGTGPGWDAIVLDVDNGPDFLIHTMNADLYADAGLRAAYQRLRPGGVLAIWCQGPSPDLRTGLARLSAEVSEHLLAVQREQRHFTYAIYTARSPSDTTDPARAVPDDSNPTRSTASQSH